MLTADQIALQNHIEAANNFVPQDAHKDKEYTVYWTIRYAGGMRQNAFQHFKNEAEAVAWAEKWLHSEYEIRPRKRYGWVDGKFIEL